MLPTLHPLTTFYTLLSFYRACRTFSFSSFDFYVASGELTGIKPALGCCGNAEG